MDIETPAPTAVPAGFEPLTRSGPFFASLGPMFLRREDHGWTLGLRLAPQHANVIGVAHGGLLAALADGALGLNLMRSGRYDRPLVTVNLSTDFLSAARIGEWLQARVQPRKLGSRLAFADCLISAGERPVLRASGVFAVVDDPRLVRNDG